MAQSIVVFSTSDRAIFARHVSELPPDSIFGKETSPPTDLDRPFPIPFAAKVLEHALAFHRTPFSLDAADHLDDLLSLASMLGFSELRQAVAEHRASAKKKKRTVSRKPSPAALGKPLHAWTVDDPGALVIKYVVPLDPPDIARIDTSIVPVPTMGPACSVQDFFAKTADVEGAIVPTLFDNWSAWLRGNDLVSPAVSKKEATDVAAGLRDAVASYKRCLPGFNENNAYHLFSFCRDSFHGPRYADLVAGIPSAANDLDPTRFFFDLAFADLAGWIAMAGGHGRITPEHLLARSLFKDPPKHLEDRVVGLVKRKVSEICSSARLVHECLASDARSASCPGCQIHPDYVSLQRKFAQRSVPSDTF